VDELQFEIIDLVV